MPKHKKPHFPAVLLILDGWGMAPPGKGNAISQAKTPNMDRLWRQFPHAQLRASGTSVGLPPRQAGNSEAGHLNIGAGRVIDQDAVRISRSINDGTFHKNPALIQAVRHVNKNNSVLHLMGMLTGDQSPHADPDHLLALIMLCRQHLVKKVALHLFTDGRDSPTNYARELIGKLNGILDPKREVIATIAGRFYMDRKKMWQRTERIYNVLTGQALQVNKAESALDAIKTAYASGKTDEFIQPTIIKDNEHESPRISDNDAIIFYNLRSDRARQLTKPFVQVDFDKKNSKSFVRRKVLANIIFVAMTDFGPDLGDILTAYPSQDVKGSLPMVLKNYRQLYIAESEKFAHVTYFLNGGYSHPVAGEMRLLVESPDVKKYDLLPEMSASAITDTVVTALDAGRFDFITLNLANADMIGHTGNIKAAIKSVEYLDKKIGEIANVVKKKNGLLFVCADHGNAEEMINMKDGAITQHSDSLTPFIIANFANDKKRKLKTRGTLGNIAPTILESMGIKTPPQMTGTSLWH
ncbi:2,3-bisphosphoglycerate-independent phosphoglycerate mutase [Patescibacteria group bacterium]